MTHLRPGDVEQHLQRSRNELSGRRGGAVGLVDQRLIRLVENWKHRQTVRKILGDQAVSLWAGVERQALLDSLWCLFSYTTRVRCPALRSRSQCTRPRHRSRPHLLQYHHVRTHRSESSLQHYEDHSVAGIVCGLALDSTA